MQEVSHIKPRIHLLVCVNDRTSQTMPLASCAPGINANHVAEIKAWILANGWVRDVFCSKTLCLGLCHEEGAVAAIYPSGRFFKHISGTEQLKQIILDERQALEKQ